MEDLGFDNIMSDLEIGDLFGGEVEGSGEPVTQKKENDVSDA